MDINMDWIVLYMVYGVVFVAVIFSWEPALWLLNSRDDEAVKKDSLQFWPINSDFWA